MVGSSSNSTSASVTSTRASMASRCQPPLRCFSGLCRSASGTSSNSSATSTRQLFAPPLVSRERLQHGRMEGPVHQSFRHILLDIAHRHRQPSGSGDLTFARFHRACDAAQQGGFSATVGGDKPDPVAGIDDEVEPGKQRRAQRHAEIADVDSSHDRSLVLPRDHDIRGMQPSSDVSVKARRWMRMQA